MTEIYDCTSTDKDTHRFCTLNLAGPMKLKDGQSKLIKMRIVFQATSFKEEKDWGENDEVAKWGPRVIVSFQENYWVDAKSHVYGLKMSSD